SDAMENVAANRARLGRALDIPEERLVTLNQVHGSSILLVDEAYMRRPLPVDADGAITALANVPIGVLTADCLPLLFYDPVRKAAGAAHAGWKGALAMVAKKTVEAMSKEFGTRPEDVRASAGPYIGECCYAVGEEVFSAFRGSFGGAASGFFKRRGGRLYLDIGRAVEFDLDSSGVPSGNITSVMRCTSCNQGLFFSYRRDGGKTGRQLSFIMLKGASKN
ncbi:MAG: peptidoglycan editing factor PgeF, partial [Deltaproteobacteria bacterium]|nr:peptidoglycan editing factor PgeF [Deltaproteobacteria bacterium]